MLTFAPDKIFLMELSPLEIEKLKKEQAMLAKKVSLVSDWLSASAPETASQSPYPLFAEPASPLPTPAPENLPIDFLAGCDVTFLDVWKTPTIGIACVKILSFPEMKEQSEAIAEEQITFPYIPGLLAYRELPALISAYKKLDARFRLGSHLRTIFIIDGQGIAHYRGLGIASHFGVETGEITIGCAKSRLYGRFVMPEVPMALSRKSALSIGEIATASMLMDEKSDKRIGTVLRVSASVSVPEKGLRRASSMGETKNLLFISPGHRIDFETSERVIRASLTRHIQPEPTRLAHNRLQQIRRKLLSISS